MRLCHKSFFLATGGGTTTISHSRENGKLECCAVKVDNGMTLSYSNSSDTESRQERQIIVNVKCAYC